MNSTLRFFSILGLLSSSRAAADPILPAPDQGGVDAVLADLAKGFQRQQDIFATAENGLSLDVFFNPADVTLVRNFFAQSPGDDFEAITGRSVFSVIAAFAEHGDEGNFSGVSSVGVAARLMVLVRDRGPAGDILRARDSAVRAARAWHVFGSIGGPGVVARGVRRTRPLRLNDRPLPGVLPDLTPLKDGSGKPLPTNKEGAWRAPVAAGLTDWIWLDDTSKDQVSGYALAVVWLWDALKDDPLVPAEVTNDLAADILAFANALRRVSPEYGIDLCIRDADGRLTAFHDLNPREVVPGGVVAEETRTRNGFNAVLALAIIRAAYHLSGDDALGRYYYEELVGRRDLPKMVRQTSGIVFLNESTNFSNVNMLAIAYATLMRIESDKAVRARLEDSLEHAFWNTGDSRDVSHVKQAWFDAVYGAYAPTAAGAAITARIRENLSGFQPAPAFERDRTNCTDADVMKGSCLAVDGKTIIQLSTEHGHGGTLVAKEIVPMAVRPDTDFEWRSDPFEVNGGGSSLMDPRGDYLAAYWLARLSDHDPTKNLSPHARPPLPYLLASDGGNGADAGAGASGNQSGGCATMGITAGGGAATLIGLGFLSLIAGLLRRRSARARRNG